MIFLVVFKTFDTILIAGVNGIGNVNAIKLITRFGKLCFYGVMLNMHALSSH